MASRIAAFARDELGLTLNRGQARAVEEWEAGQYQQAAWRWGRRGGKSTLADVLALYDVSMRDHLRKYLRPGEPRISAIIAPTVPQAQRHIENCRGMIAHSPRLRAALIGSSSDELRFANDAGIRAYPASARGIRGDAWSSVILDELGHFVSTEDGNAAGDRILEGAGPALAQFGSEGWLIAISTPRWRVGAFAKLVERAESGKYPYAHGLHLSTAEANEAIDTRWLAERQLEDPDTFSREYLALFLDGASAYLSSADVVACLRAEKTLAPVAGAEYAGAVDPAYSGDNFSMAVGHQREDGSVVIDGVWVWHRAGHESTMTAVAEVARSYGISKLRTDQHAAVPVQEALAARNIQSDYQPWTNESKIVAFSRLKIALSTRSVELPHDDALVVELCGLEARPTPGGFTRIAAAGSGHDDRAIVVAAVVEGLIGSAGQGPAFAQLWRLHAARADQHAALVAAAESPIAEATTIEPMFPREPRRLATPWCPRHMWSREDGRCVKCGAFMPTMTGSST